MPCMYFSYFEARKLNIFWSLSVVVYPLNFPTDTLQDLEFVFNLWPWYGTLHQILARLNMEI